jgi:lycopene cyclase domain-containing protein
VEYTWAAVAGVLAVVLVEVAWLRTGIFRTATFWIAYGIVVFFQVLVDGWLTKLSSPIVVYNEDKFTGWRAPFDVPVEDYLFGFALVTLTILIWVKVGPLGHRHPDRRSPGDESTSRTGTEPSPRR